MLTSQQIDTIQGIVCNYDCYVVYNYSDYHTYAVNEERDSRIIIYCGNDDAITFQGNAFVFSEDVECYAITYNKYMNAVANPPSSFSVPASEMVYTNLVSNYPQLCYFDSMVHNADYGKWLVICVVGTLALDVIFKVIFGGKD